MIALKRRIFRIEVVWLGIEAYVVIKQILSGKLKYVAVAAFIFEHCFTRGGVLSVVGRNEPPEMIISAPNDDVKILEWQIYSRYIYYKYIIK
jgi:hypothetical protein